MLLLFVSTKVFKNDEKCLFFYVKSSFEKMKKCLELVPCLILCMIFEEKYCSRHIQLADQMLLLAGFTG